MATIKTYESQVLPTKEAASAYASPALATQGPETARAGMGKEVADIGFTWQQMKKNAYQANEFNSNIAHLDVDLSDLYRKTISDPNYMQNPDQATGDFQEQSRKLINDRISTIRDQHVKDMVQQHSEGLWGAHTKALNDWNVNQHVKILHAGGLDNIQTFEKAAVNAPNDELFNKSMKGIDASIEGLHKGGLISDEQYVKMRDQEPKRVLTRRAEAEIAVNPDGFIQRLDDPNGIFSRLDDSDRGKLREHASVKSRTLKREAEHEEDRAEQKRKDEAYKSSMNALADKHGLGKPTGNYNKAAQDALDPEIGSSLGLTDPDQRAKVARDIIAQGEMFRNESNKLQHDTDVDAWNRAMDGKLSLGAVDGDVNQQTQLRPSPSARDKIKDYIVDKDNKQKYHDINVYTQTEKDILGGRITNREDIWSKVGFGIGPKDAEHFTNVLNSIINKPMQRALQQFDKKMAEGAVYGQRLDLVQSAKPAFNSELQSAIDKENLTDYQILDKAEELYPKYKKIIEEEGKRQTKEKSDARKAEQQSKSWWNWNKSQPKTSQPEQKNPVKLSNDGYPVYEQPDGSMKVDRSVKPTVRKDESGNTIYEMPNGFRFMVKPKPPEEQPQPPKEPSPAQNDDRATKQEPDLRSSIETGVKNVLNTLLSPSEAQAGEIPGAKVGNLLGYDTSGRAIYDAWEATGELSKEKDSDKWTLKPPEDELDEEGRDHNQFRARLNDVLADPEQRAELFRRVLMGDIGIDWDISPEEIMKDINRSDKEGHGLNEELWNKIVEHIKPSDASPKEQGGEGLLNKVMDFLGPSEAKAMSLGPQATGFKQAQREGKVVPDKYSGKPQFEISDNQATFSIPLEVANEADRKGTAEFSSSLGNLYRHEELYRNYPELKNIPVKLHLGEQYGTLKGSYDDKDNEINLYSNDSEEILDTLTHEVQHWVQDKEGWPRGGGLFTGLFLRGALDWNEKTLKKDKEALLKFLPDAIQAEASGTKGKKYKTIISSSPKPDSSGYIPSPKFVELGEQLVHEAELSPDESSWMLGKYAFLSSVKEIKQRLSEIDDYLERIEELKKRVKGSSNLGDAMHDYKSLSGEIQSRDAEARRKMTPEERSEVPLYSSENVPEEEAIKITPKKKPKND